MSEELTFEERREWAKTLYTKLEYTVANVSAEVGIDKEKVESWIIDGGWDGVRLSLVISRGRQLKLMYDVVQQLNERVQADPGAIKPSDADIIVKYTKAIKNLEGDVTPAQMTDVFDMFYLWVKKKDMTFARMMVPRWEEFHKLHTK